MRIIIDSNILFSALIKDSTTRKLIINFSGKFLFPEFIFDEFYKYKKFLLKKSKLSENEMNLLLKMILNKVEIVENYKILKNKKEAIMIMKNIDIKDVVFIATAIEYDAILWSDDKNLKKQDRVSIINTKEFIELFTK